MECDFHSFERLHTRDGIPFNHEPEHTLGVKSFPCCHSRLFFLLFAFLVPGSTDDRTRVKLRQRPGDHGSDYINASFLDVSVLKNHSYVYTAVPGV